MSRTSVPVRNYIVIGGGSAGCVIAARLSEDPAASVTLLEEGPSDWSPYIRYPGTYYKTAQGSLLKRYRWEPTPGAGRDGTDTMVQASVLGGGSSVNAMVYIRGNPRDYDRWAEAGARGWSYRDVLPYFKRSEDNEDFCDETHAVGGPLGIARPGYIHPLTKIWLRACQQAGFEYRSDFNDGHQEGCGIYQLTARNGRRSSAVTAFLRPAMGRPNLQVVTGARVTRIVVENGRAVGAEFVRRGKAQSLRANTEVILSAGAINSPRLLLLSGIGPASQLKALNIPVQADLPGVGHNLQDHLEMSMIYELKGIDSYDRYKSMLWKPWAALQFLVAGTGPIASNLIEGGGFSRGSATDELADLQYFLVVGAGIEEGVDTVPSGNGCTINFGQVRPKSRGTVALRSADPTAPPLIAPNYLSEQYDIDCLSEGLLKVQEIMRAPEISRFISRRHFPKHELHDRAEIAAFLRRNVHAALHPTGTCRMGEDPLSVVDSELRLHAVTGLRVADASVMPNIVSGNTNAACIMIGEKAADHIRGRNPAAASESARVLIPAMEHAH